MTSRIDFASANPAQLHALRDRWLEAAQGTKLPKAAYQVAALLPTYINREHGYAWPTDLDLAEIMGKTVKTVVRAMRALDEAGLIDRETRVKRDGRREAVGRERRIYLTLPEVKGHAGEVNGHVIGERTFGEGERTNVVHINLTQNPPMKKFRDKGSTREEGVPSPIHVPSPFTDDHDFIDAFDREVVRAGKGSDDAAHLAAAAFDAATDSAAKFMPFHWGSLCRLRGSDAKSWFIARAGQIRHVPTN